VTAEATLDLAFTTLLAKARPNDLPAAVRPATIDFIWTGGGQPLDATMMDPILVEVPFPARLVWAHMFAGDGTGGAVPVQATLDLRLTSLSAFGTSSPVYGTGSPPRLDSFAATNLSLDGWQLNFATGDALIAFPVTFIGTATWLALTLQLRPTESPIGITDVTDNAGDAMTFNDGSTVEFRS
jgi:hypothetical protein